MPERALRCQLTSVAWKILACVRRVPLAGPVEVRVDNVDTTVRIAVGPLDAACPEAMPGRWLSPVEMLIWNALDGKTLVGKAVASKAGQEYDSTFRVILRNLVNRGVLCHDEADGFSRAVR